MRILIVEDNPGLRALLVDLFQGAAHEVRVAPSGTKALEALSNWPPDVIIADLNLPGVQGEEIAIAAAALPQRPRLIMMSADRERLERTRSRADAVLLKPFHLDELLRLVALFQ